MKCLIILLLFSFSSFADSIELIGGSFTYHLLADDTTAQYFSNKISSDGKFIRTPLIGVAYNTIDTDGGFLTYIVFTGQNSFSQPMTGGLVESGGIYGHWNIGGVIGLYEENMIDWQAIGAVPFYIGVAGNTGFVPVLGIAVNYQIPLSKAMFFKFNNIISPLLINNSISLGWNF